MSYIITGADSAGAVSLKRDSAAAPDGRIYGHPEFDQLHAAEGA